MNLIDLTITARSPLAIGQRKPGGSVSEAFDYIPGTVIRGAVAKEILRHSSEAPQPGDDFHRLFLDETATVFQNAYPAIARPRPNEYFEAQGVVDVLPASALSSKINSGFQPRQSGVFDSLIDSFCATAQGHFYVPNDLAGHLVEPFGGFYSKDEKGYYSHAVSKRLLTRVGINRKRATAQDEILYSIEVMNESQGKPERVQTVYRSSALVQGNEAFAQELHRFLQQHCTNLRVGGSASRGLGKVELTAAKPVAASSDTIPHRIKAFNDKLSERWRLWAVLNGGEDPTETRSFFTLDLQSDAILSENWRRTTVVSPAMLAPLVDLSEADITLHTAYSSYDYRSGWNAAWGLPKDTELVTKMGGVMLFSIPKEKQSTCENALAILEKVGIGSRCSEGYGQLKVCDEFHLVMRENP
ncbi:MAG: CRISPR-associated RAMP protein Csx10, partial [Cyanobacteria bacterium J06555_13]